jgi:hypothetical protein
MKIRHIIEILLLFLIIGLIWWFVFFKKDKPIEPSISYVYITDTIYDSIPYSVPEPYPISTSPRTVTIYLIDSLALDSLTLLLSQQSILIAGLKDTIRIHEGYLKQYPYNPKLVAIDLRRDTMSMGLLNITGIPQEDRYPLDLGQFDYRWNYEAGLTRHPTQTPPIEEQQPFAYYFVGGGVDLLYLSPYLSGKMEKDWARIRLYGTVNVGLLKRESSGIFIGIDYKLNGQNRP